MDDDLAVAKVLDERKLELKTGASALVRRLRQLETRGKRLQTDLQDRAGSRELFLDEIEELDEDKRACQWQLYTLTADAIGTEYTAVDVAAWCQRAVEMGASHPRLNARVLEDLINIRIVPNAPFRDWVLRALGHRLSMRSVVVAVHRQLEDIERKTGKAHGSASLFFGSSPQTRILKRWLGMEPMTNGRSNCLALFIPYDRALALQRAFDMTPHQAGI